MLRHQMASMCSPQVVLLHLRQRYPCNVTVAISMQPWFGKVRMLPWLASPPPRQHVIVVL